MSALIIDLKDFDVRTPEQVVRIFFNLFGPETVRDQLWEIFRQHAVHQEGMESPDTVEVALLFDHLIALVSALDKLRSQTTDRCVICGRRPTVDTT